VHVAATPENVFPYFTDPARYVQWMGSEAQLEPVPGGTYRVQMPDGFRAGGTFLQIDPPHRLAFTWGFMDGDAAQLSKHEQTEASSGNPMPAGSTRVTVTLYAADGGTRLTLRHDDLPNSELRDGHRGAWETYLPPSRRKLHTAKNTAPARIDARLAAMSVGPGPWLPPPPEGEV
jgi:uncharacterized protein YndB with AHSA1/START domain